MEKVFVNAVNLSLVLSLIFAFVIILRLVLRKVSNSFALTLWGAIVIRALLPFSFKSRFSLIPSLMIFNSADISTPSFRIFTGISLIDNIINNLIGDRYFEGVSVSYGTMFNVAKYCTILWIAGILLLTVYSVFRYFKLKQSLRTAIKIKDNIFKSEFINNAFVFGVFKPKIYLPCNMKKCDYDLVVLHEKSHLSHFDHIYKLLGYMILIVNWFNPIIWLAFKLFCKDLEFACDERVINKMTDRDMRKDYASTVLKLSVQNPDNYLSVNFGGNDIKSRVRNIMTYKKPAKILKILLTIFTLVFVFSVITTQNLPEKISWLF